MAISTLLAAGLRLFCPRDRCKAIEVTVPAGGYSAGQIVKHEGVVGISYADYDEGDTGVLLYDVPDVEVACAAATEGDYAVGAPVFFDEADAEVNETSAGNTYCGVVMVQPATGAEKVRISLFGLNDGLATDTDTDTDEYVATAEFAAAGIGGAFFVAPVACEVVSAVEVHGTKAGQAGTLQIEKCASGEAAGAGDAILATTFDLAGDNLVPQTALAVDDGTQELAAGDVLRTKVASGAADSLADAVLSVRIRRL